METISRRASVEALKNLAYNADRNISFSPEKNGERYLNDLETGLTEFLSQIPEEFHVAYEAKYISLYRDWLAARSRCISSMITGPARFPTRRAEKYNNWERSAYERLVEWRDRITKRLNRTERLTGWDEIERLTSKIETLTSLQTTMKGVNAIIRRKITDEEKIERIMGEWNLSEAMAKKTLEPDCYGERGFASYVLTNNNAKIKNTKERRDRLIRDQNTENVEYDKNGVSVEENAAQNRIRLFFNGKPNEEIRTKLKRNGFKWSPKVGAWQNYLNPSSKRFVQSFLEELDTDE